MVKLNIIFYLLENYKTHFLFTSIYSTSAFSTYFYTFSKIFLPQHYTHKIILFCGYNKNLLELFMEKHFTGRVFILNYFIYTKIYVFPYIFFYYYF